jgi:hypothetical protein
VPLPIVSHLSVSAELRERLTRKRLNFLGNLVRPAGFEPAAFGSGGSTTSMQLARALQLTAMPTRVAHTLWQSKTRQTTQQCRALARRVAIAEA